jgi:hypothetical protein
MQKKDNATINYIQLLQQEVPQYEKKMYWIFL